MAALDGGPDGLDLIRRLLITQLPDVLRPAGVALLEIGSDQADAALRRRARAGRRLARSTIHDDLAGRPRVLEIATDRLMARVLAASNRQTRSTKRSRRCERGELVGIPTETVYGVLRTARRRPSVERLIEAKQRSAEKGIQLLVDSLDQVRAPRRRHDAPPSSSPSGSGPVD